MILDGFVWTKNCVTHISDYLKPDLTVYRVDHFSWNSKVFHCSFLNADHSREIGDIRRLFFDFSKKKKIIKLNCLQEFLLKYFLTKFF